MFSICTYIADNDDALNLVEGERVYVIGKLNALHAINTNSIISRLFHLFHLLERHNSDWWFVQKHLTMEKGWVPSQYLMDGISYTHYVQRKLNEKIDKLPVFESKFCIPHTFVLTRVLMISIHFQSQDQMIKRWHLSL